MVIVKTFVTISGVRLHLMDTISIEFFNQINLFIISVSHGWNTCETLWMPKPIQGSYNHPKVVADRKM